MPRVDERRRSSPAAGDRRIRKTQRALREAFIALVLERGYDAVTVEQITDRADVARATFYMHFGDKEQLLTKLFEELTAELVESMPTAVRTNLVRDLYAHAAQYRDLYRVCLRGAGHGRARAAYLDVVAAKAEAVFGERRRVSKQAARLPLPVLGRAFGGAHVALLEDWLEQEARPSVDSAAQMQRELLAKGFGWALGIQPDDLGAAFPGI